jgi:hypothetical protein
VFQDDSWIPTLFVHARHLDHGMHHSTRTFIARPQSKLIELVDFVLHIVDHDLLVFVQVMGEFEICFYNYDQSA